MNMKKTILFAIVAFMAMIKPAENVHTKLCNDYFDGILKDLKDSREYFEDPYVIHDKTLFVSKKVVFVNYTGEAIIHEGFIYGLSSLHREGDITADKWTGKYLKVNLGAGVLNMVTKGQLKMMGHGAEADVEATISYIQASLDLIPGENGTNPMLRDFKIVETKGVEVKTSGLGPLDFVLNSYIGFMRFTFLKLVRVAVERSVKRFLAEKVTKYAIPKECM